MRNALNNSTSLILRITIFFWLTGKLISYPLWTASRNFPLVPVVDFLQAGNGVHLILLIVSLSSMLVLLIKPDHKFAVTTLLTAEAIAWMLDQNRWQPWHYQYFLTVLFVWLNRNKEKNVLTIILFMLVSTYFYSGLSKLNPAFIQSIWNRLVLGKAFHLSQEIIYSKTMFYIGYSISVIEMIFAVGLIFEKTRKAAIILLLMMHVLILAVFGPFGLNYDMIVWPWNVAMMCYLTYFLVKGKYLSISYPVIFQKWNIVFTALFGIMPLLNYAGLWDYFLSSSLFSSKTPDMYVCIPKEEAGKFPKASIAKFSFCDSNEVAVNVRLWAFEEMAVPGAPQVRVFKKIRKQLLEQYPNIPMHFWVFEYNHWKKQRRELTD